MSLKEFAKENGFDGARFLTTWKGKKCYEAITFLSRDGDGIPVIGFPQIIISDTHGFRMADYDEALEIVRGLKE